MIATLRGILGRCRELLESAFTGVGVIVCDTPDTLPIVPIRPVSTPPSGMDLVRSLAAISIPGSEYHDGFHIVSSDWQLTRCRNISRPQ